MIKKITALGAACAIALSQTGVFAEDLKVISDGKIHLEFTGAQSGEEVCIIVLPDGRSWMDETAWKNGNLKDEYLDATDNYNYFDTVTADTNGAYSVDFYANTPGFYNVTHADKELRVKYIKDTENAAVVNEIKQAQSADDIYAILSDTQKVDTLGLDDEIFVKISNDTKVTDNKTALEILAEIAYPKLTSMSGTYETQQKEAEAVSDIIRKAGIIVMLNGEATETISDIDAYKDSIDTDDKQLLRFYNSSNSKAVTDMLKKSRISGMDNFDSRFIETVCLTNISQNDNTGTVLNMLKAYTNEMGITNTQNINDEVVRSMVGKSFDNMAAVGTYVNNYTSTSNGGSSGGSSSSGGGSSSRNPSSSIVGGIVAPAENPAQSLQTRNVFADTESVEWANEAINTLAKKGIIAGRTDTEFMPNDTIKREEFVKLIVSLFSLNVIGEEPEFSDVSESDWFYSYLKSAYNAEIISGVSENMFGTGMNITRQDMAVIAAKSAYTAGVELAEINAEKEFTDSADIADYARESVAKLQKAGIMSGDENGAFNPRDNATRAQAAQIIYMLYKQL